MTYGLNRHSAEKSFDTPWHMHPTIELQLPDRPSPRARVFARVFLGYECSNSIITNVAAAYVYVIRNLHIQLNSGLIPMVIGNCLEHIDKCHDQTT